MTEENNENQKINLNIENENNEVEFQRYITNANDLEKNFYMALAGYRIVKKEKKSNIENDIIEEFYIDANSRLCNEACVNYIYNSCYFLINHLTTTSKLKDSEIKLQWLYKAKIIANDLAFNYFFENNTFEIKHYFYIPSIIEIILSLVPISKKALEGFTLMQSKEIKIVQELNRNIPLQQQPQQRGFFSRLGSIFS